MKITRRHVGGALASIALMSLLPIMAFAARTATVVTSLIPGSNFSVNLTAPTVALSSATTSGTVYSNGGNTMYFAVAALDGAGGQTVVSNLLGTSTLNQAHGWNITWTNATGSSAYRVYFSTSTPQALTQYFNATTTGKYSFQSTSSPVYIPAGPPATNTAYTLNLVGSGTSWVNGGSFGVGTTTPFATLGVAGSGWFSGNSLHVGDTVTTLAGGPCTLVADTCFELVGNDNTTAGVTSILQNTSAGTSAYSDIYFANDLPQGLSNYVALTLNSSTYNSTFYGTALAVPSQFSVQSTFGPVLIAATATSSTAAANISFVVNGVDTFNEAMRIIANRNVGIGTTSPQTKLEVVATSSGVTTLPLFVSNFGSATSTAAGLAFRTSDVSNGTGTSTASIAGVLTKNFNGGNGDLVFSNLLSGTLAEKMRLTSAGNLGLGTSTPTTNLQVTTLSANATTTLTVGKASQTKGSCLEMFDSVGTASYVSVVAGALVVSATSCK